MTKTLDDYMNDPELAHEPMALREIHAIRLQIYDETKDMTDAEYNALVDQRAMDFLNRAKSRKKLRAEAASAE